MRTNKSSLPICILLGLLMLSSCTGIQIDTKQGGAQTSWPTSTPEKQGMDSATLVKLLEYIEGQGKGIDSLLVIRNGYLVLETYYAPYTGDQWGIPTSNAGRYADLVCPTCLPCPIYPLRTHRLRAGTRRL